MSSPTGEHYCQYIKDLDVFNKIGYCSILKKNVFCLGICEECEVPEDIWHKQDEKEILITALNKL